MAEKLREVLADSEAADVVAAPNKLPVEAAGLLPVKLKADLTGSVAAWDLALNIEL